jgi:hypothetical protein
MTMCLDLAEANLTRAEQQVLFWGVVLMGVVVAGVLVILMLKRMLRQEEGPATADAGFSLSELRAMRDRGEITPEEYEQTRSRVIAKVKSNASRGKAEGVAPPQEPGEGAGGG